MPYKSPGFAQDLTILGAVLDYMEVAVYYYPPIVDINAAIDATVAGGSSILAGETYLAKPHETLPTMLVVGQDVLVNGGDFVVGTGGKWAITAGGISTGNPSIAMVAAISGVGLDIVTSAGSAIHDTARVFGPLR